MKLYLCCGRKTGVKDPSAWLGIDNDPKVYPDLLADVRTLSPWMFPGLEEVLATPLCGGFTELPWRHATGEGLDVLMACWDFCNDAGVPWLLENSRFAQKWLGPADFHRGPHYFWSRGMGLIPVFTHYKGGTSGLDPLKRAAMPRML